MFDDDDDDDIILFLFFFFFLFFFTHSKIDGVYCFFGKLSVCGKLNS